MRKLDSQKFVKDACTSFASQTAAESLTIEQFLDSKSAKELLPAKEYRDLVVHLVRQEIASIREQGDSPNAAALSKRFPEIGLETFEDMIFMPEIPGTLQPLPLLPTRYQMLQKVGRGGIGEVWRVHDDEMDRTMAIKILLKDHQNNPTANHRLHREATVTGQLQHPGIPPVYEQGSLRNGSRYFAMKLVEGETLATILTARRDELPFLISVFEQIAQTVAYAHSRNVVHRDLKPENIMVGEFGEVQVMDWGMAKSNFKISTNQQPLRKSDSLIPATATDTAEMTKATTLDNPPGTKTRFGDVLGTPAYMAPEQARGENDFVGPRSDVFALGAMLFEVLTGSRVYDDASSIQTLEQAATGTYGSIQGRLEKHSVDKELSDLCCRCLDFESSNRPANGRQVADAVASYQANVQTRLKRVEIDQAAAEVKSREQRKRAKTLGLMSLLVAIVSTLGAAGFAWQWSKAKKEAKSRTKINEFLIVDFLGSLDDDNRYVNDLAPKLPNPNLTVREVLDRAANKAAARFEGDPEIESDVRNQLGLSYAALGEMKEAGEQYRISLDLISGFCAPDDDRILTNKHRLVEVLIFEEKYVEALETMESLVDHFAKTDGELADNTLIMKSDLSSVLVHLDRFEEAEKLCREVTETLELAEIDELGINHCRVKWASTLTELSRFEEAEEQLSVVLESLDEKVKIEPDGSAIVKGEPSDFQDFLRAKASLANLYEYQGKIKAAEVIHQQRLHLNRQTKGNDHPTTLKNVTDLAVCYLRMGRYKYAKELLAPIIVRQEKVFGDEHDTTLRSKDSLAAAYTLLNEFELAEPLFLDTRAALLSKTPLPRLDLTRNSNNLGGLYIRLKRYEEAEKLLSEAVEVMEELLGLHNLDSIRTMSNLAKAQGKLAKYALSENTFLEVLRHARESYPPTHQEILLTTEDLLKMYASSQQYEKAIELNDELIEKYAADLELAESKKLDSLIKMRKALEKKLDDK